MADPVLTQEEIEAAVGDPVEEWDARCHEISAALAPLVGGVVRRGYFTGEKKEGAYFHGMFSQHSWIELPDGRVCDPTRHAMDLSPRWPLWIGDDADYDIAGCRSQPAYGQPEQDAVPEGENVALRMSRRALASTGLDMVLEPWQTQQDEGDMVFVALSRRQLMWLANLPIKDRFTLGAIPRQHAREIYQAIVDADYAEAIPIDRRDWILESGGALYGRTT